MTDNNKYVETHELYNKFCQWLGVTNTSENTYSMINYSLHSAELFLNAQYGINTSISTHTNQVANSSNFQFPHSPTKILNMFKETSICYPTISYLDTSSYNLITEIGDYLPDLSDARLAGKYTATYLTGYVQKTSVVELDSSNDEYKLNPPIFEINKVAVVSPVTLFENAFDLTVIGNKTNKVFIDNVEVGAIGDDGKLVVPITLSKEVSDIVVKLTDTNGEKDSNTVTLVFILSNVIPTPTFHILGYTQRINTKNISIKVIKPSMAKLYYKVDNITTALTDLTDASSIMQLDIPFETERTSKKVIVELYVVKDGKQSESRFILVDFNEVIKTEYLKELNKDALSVPYLPEDLMVGMFKLAKHFYTGTLYNNSSVDKYNTVSSESVSYISHTIPKDVLSLVASYVSYV